VLILCADALGHLAASFKRTALFPSCNLLSGPVFRTICKHTHHKPPQGLNKDAPQGISGSGGGGSPLQSALILQCEHWLEAADPKHRYGTNLRPYFEYWLEEMRQQEQAEVRRQEHHHSQQQQQVQQQQPQQQQPQQQQQKQEGNQNQSSGQPQQPQQLMMEQEWETLSHFAGGDDGRELGFDIETIAAAAAAGSGTDAHRPGSSSSSSSSSRAPGAPAALAGWPGGAAAAAAQPVMHPTADDSQLANSTRFLLRQSLNAGYRHHHHNQPQRAAAGSASGSAGGAGQRECDGRAPPDEDSPVRVPMRRTHSAPRLKELSGGSSSGSGATAVAAAGPKQADTPPPVAEPLRAASVCGMAAVRAGRRGGGVAGARLDWGLREAASAEKTGAQQPPETPAREAEKQKQQQQQQQQQQQVNASSKHRTGHTHADARFFYWLAGV